MAGNRAARPTSSPQPDTPVGGDQNGASPTVPATPWQPPDAAAFYSSLVELLPVFVICKNLEGRITFVNQGFADLIGKSPHEILGKTDYDISPRELADKYQHDDRQVIQTGKPIVEVEETETENGIMCMELRRTPVCNADSEVIGTQAIFWDVTARRRSENELAHERDMLRTIMDHLPDFIYVKDPQGRYVIVNEAVREILGADSVEAVKKRSNTDFLPSQEAKAQQADDNQVLSSGKALIDRELRMLDQHGDELWLLTSKIPICHKDGHVTGLVGIDRNITHLKKSEEQLRRAKEVADSANKAKGDFLANMSHEIRTPMNAIIGMTDLLLETQLTATQREYLEMVQASGDSLLTLINDILDFSKIEAGKLELDPSVFDIRESLGDTMRSIGLRAHSKGLELAFEVDPNVPRLVEGDLGRLRQILVNLTGNAIKFTEQGEVVLEVSCDRQAEEEVWLKFAVSDTGIGIAPEKCQKIFEEFEQADGSTTRRFGGSGLGLAISSRLVALMDGKIWVDSDLGKGSRFQFTACMKLAARPEAAQPPHQIINQTPVLVVDDNATNRRILQDMLRNWGMLPQLVNGGREALSELSTARKKGQSFPLVISDVNMPEMDGYMLAERIRSEAQFGTPQIITLTSGVRPEDEHHCRRLRIAAHLMKPIKQSELFDAILSALYQVTHDKASVAEHTAPQPEAKRLRILLAEDNLVNQKLAIGVLESLGHTIVLASDGRQTVEAHATDTFDLILMDVQMPVMDGLTATKMIRDAETAAGKQTPIVAMTAHAMKGDREICLAAGMDAYIAKPIRVQMLAKVLASLFASESDLDSSCATPSGAETTSSMVDWDEALRSVDGNGDLLREVIGALLEDAPELIAEVCRAIEEQDAGKLQRAAHSLKGSLLFLNVPEPIQKAQTLEQLAVEESFSGAGTIFNSLQKDMSLLLGTLQHYVSEPDTIPNA